MLWDEILVVQCYVPIISADTAKIGDGLCSKDQDLVKLRICKATSQTACVSNYMSSK